MRFAAAIAVYLVASISWASDDDRRGGDVDVDVGGDTTTLTGGDTTVNAGDLIGGDVSHSSKAFAFSHSLGDVDINEGQNCLGSEQWGTIIVSRQTNELNPWCAALFYELNGKHEFAAKMRCDIKAIRTKYDDDAECVTDQTLGGYSEAAPPELAALTEAHVEEDNERDYMAAQLAAEIMNRQDELEQRLDREATRRRAVGAELAKKKQDDAEYAQQALEQFQQIANSEQRE